MRAMTAEERAEHNRKRREAYAADPTRRILNQQWKDANREKVREKERGYAAKARAADPERFKATWKRYRRAHPEEVKSRTAAWFAAHPEYASDKTNSRIKRDPVGWMLYRCRRRAEQKGVPFSLTEADVTIPTVCPVLGIPIGSVRGRGMMHPNAASLDRIIPSLGYVPGNVAVISWRANQLKRDGTPDELEAVAKYARREVERVLRGAG